MYVKCEDIFGVRQLFERIEERDDIVLWNSIIFAYFEGGKFIEVLIFFREMQEIGVGMNIYIFVFVL